jgi:hypothetical protein
MGRAYLYECPRCGYRARVAGARSEGIWFHVQTLACAECSQLFDAVVEMKFPVPPLQAPLKTLRGRKKPIRLARLDTPPEAPSFQAALNRLPPTGARSYRWIKFKLACPVSARHRVAEWESPGKCPKCRTFMDRSALPFRNWD